MSETNPNDANPNPYAPGIVQQKEILSDVEEVRKHHLSHEASVKSIGILFIAGGLFGILAAFSFFSAFSSMPGTKNPLIPHFTFVLLIVLALTMLVTAFGIRKLKAWSRIPAVVLSSIGLLVFPMGTLVNLYILFLLLSKKSSMVFSPEYKEIIVQTPHMKYRTSLVAFITTALIVATIAIVAMVAIRFAG